MCCQNSAQLVSFAVVTVASCDFLWIDLRLTAKSSNSVKPIYHCTTLRLLYHLHRIGVHQNYHGYLWKKTPQLTVTYAIWVRKLPQHLASNVTIA